MNPPQAHARLVGNVALHPTLVPLVNATRCLPQVLKKYDALHGLPPCLVHCFTGTAQVGNRYTTFNDVLILWYPIFDANEAFPA